MLRDNRGQIFTIIEILVVAVIIIVLASVLLRGYMGAGSKAPGGPATPQERARSVSCANNLQQIRYAIMMFQQTHDKFPTSLAETASSGGLSDSMLKCDVSGKPYGYDPAQGRVWCTTPGHERY